MMQWYAYGHDFGNPTIGGAVQIAGMGKPHTRSIPTAVARLDVAAMRTLGIQLEAPGHHLIQLENDEDTYAVGELALQQGKDSWDGRSDISRYASTHSVCGMLTFASSLTADQQFGLYVVTGLPTETFLKNADLREQIKQALSGTSTFTIDQGKSYRRIVVQVSQGGDGRSRRVHLLW